MGIREGGEKGVKNIFGFEITNFDLERQPGSLESVTGGWECTLRLLIKFWVIRPF